MPGRRPSPTFATSNLQIKARWRYVRDFNSVACLQTSYKSWKQLKRRHAWFFGWFSSCLWIRTCGWLGGELQWPVQEIDVYTLHTLLAGETFDLLTYWVAGLNNSKYCGHCQKSNKIIQKISTAVTNNKRNQSLFQSLERWPVEQCNLRGNHDISNINHDISYYIYNSLRSAERNTIPVEYNQ